ncbi:MAG: DUF934 domain-containing protein [Candidatus Eutrophobiaceae bacterium]
MRTLKDQIISDDAWILSREVQEELPEAPIIIPYSRWQEHRDALTQHSHELGVWIDGDCDLDALIDSGLLLLPLIAVDFPKFTDGRAYSLARLLRERYGYSGEIRAIGEILRDQLFFMMRCGIDSFCILEGSNEKALINAFNDLSVRYQAACDEKLPLYRRR